MANRRYSQFAQRHVGPAGNRPATGYGSAPTPKPAIKGTGYKCPSPSKDVGYKETRGHIADFTEDFGEAKDADD